MKKKFFVLLAVCLLAAWALPTHGADVISAVPGEAYGFIAAKSMEGSYENLRSFVGAIGFPDPTMGEGPWDEIRDSVGDVDPKGPAAMILLDPEEFGDEPFALLLSANDPQAVVQAWRDRAGDTDDDLPQGVVKVEDGYIAVRQGFVVFATNPEHAGAVANSETAVSVMPEVHAAFAKGEIVLSGDMANAALWLIQKLDELKEEMAQGMSMGAGMSASMAGPGGTEFVEAYVGMIQSLIGQCDRIALSLDANDQRVVLIKRAQFKQDSAAAGFVSGLSSVPVPSLTSLPGGSFLMSGALNVDPNGLKGITDAMMDLRMNMPTIKESLSEASIAEMKSETNAANAMMTGCGFTVGIGSPMSGLINAVVRYDVSDSKVWMGHGRKLCEGPSAQAMAKSSGTPMTYTYTAAADEYAGLQIDTVKMELGAPAEGAEITEEQQMQAMMTQQMMGMMFGPEMLVRMAAPSDNQVLLTMGGGAENMERAINVAKGRGTTLDQMENVKIASQTLPANRFTEAHLDLTQLMPMMMMTLGAAGMQGQMPSPPEGGAVPISMSASAETNTLRVDLIVPTESIKALMEMAQQMNPGRGGPQRYEEDDYEWEEDVEGDF